jgi:hypothetical protein
MTKIAWLTAEIIFSAIAISLKLLQFRRTSTPQNIVN